MSYTQYGYVMQDYVQNAVFIVLPIIGLALTSMVARDRRWPVVAGMILLIAHGIGDIVWNKLLVDVVDGGVLPSGGITTVVALVGDYLPVLALVAGILFLVIGATRRATPAPGGPVAAHGQPSHQPAPSPWEPHGHGQGRGPYPPTAG